MLDPHLELADLHIHVGAAVAPHILWSIAHDQGFKLPVQTFWEFRDLVTAKPDQVTNLNDYLRILHQWTEKIQSSPAAIERSSTSGASSPVRITTGRRGPSSERPRASEMPSPSARSTSNR